MKWEFRNDATIYSQLIALMKLGIASGEFKPGERVPPVRDFALQAGVNPNTMQRALTELEREGLVFSQRTAGRFVTEDAQMIDETKRKLAEAQVRSFLGAMSRLGYGKDEIVGMLGQCGPADSGENEKEAAENADL